MTHIMQPPAAATLAADFLDDADAPLILMDARGRVALCNRAAQQLLGPDASAGPVTSRLLLRRVRSEGPLAWRALVGALRARLGIRLTLKMSERSVEVALRPLPQGWSVQGKTPVTGAEAREQPRTDPLTGLIDRRGLGERFAET